ncbi:hypothetical protein DFA_04869 [Cavenderia fasciculata]|uniref:Uncharacterized protein n=1 Tax=Cavenderia fasciculata TaxID=261658 RepID=F4PM36_CACFS|nr:uncharacterized protein DFA_04869 [Cavenderia fasciculata]EGG22739.1 hypothetical protein DFA_04869 [Cavenderia fasciculata]|eukprot:XP_004360590.1 hypothetical protein DFA_04869 [Cavenderia fasciculata]
MATRVYVFIFFLLLCAFWVLVYTIVRSANLSLEFCPSYHHRSREEREREERAMKSSKSVSILDTLYSNESSNNNSSNNSSTNHSTTSSHNNSPVINSINGLLPIFVTDDIPTPTSAVPPTSSNYNNNSNNMYNKYRSPSFSSGAGGVGGGFNSSNIYSSESYMKRSKSTPFLNQNPLLQSPSITSSNNNEQPQQQQSSNGGYTPRHTPRETNYNITAISYPNLANYGLSNSPSINNIQNISSQPSVNTITTTTTTTNYQQPSPSFLPFNISSFNNNGNNGNNTLPSPYLSSKYQQSNGSTNNLYRLTSNQHNNNNNNYETKDEIVHRLETQIQAILAEVELLKDRIKEMEEEQGRMKWGLKYSRRVLITSNFLLGIWVSISRVVINTPWKRQAALVASTTYSLYLAFFPQYLPWTNYFNVFASLLYITAAWSTSNSNRFKDVFKNL